VRGLGLSLAVDVADETIADRLMYACLERGLSFKVGGGTVLTLCPPLTITRAELDDAVDIVAAAFAGLG
jgi:4-aminobutyrate aminotransferase